jgi:hypothetical protein
MKRTLLFVREKAKDIFIKDANGVLKFVNKVFTEAKNRGFDKETAWIIAGIAYNRPNSQILEKKVRELIVQGAGSMEISGAKLSIEKMAELIEVPDLTEINYLIEAAREKNINFSAVPFEKIKNDSNIEIENEWLTQKLEGFNIYATDERQKEVFQAFCDMVKSVNILVSSNLQRQFFESLEMEGFLKWHTDHFVINTQPGTIDRVSNLFGYSAATAKQRKIKEIMFTGE